MSVLSAPLSSWAMPRSARALRLELKRNAVPYVLPLLAGVFYFDTVRTADGFPPVWTLRASVIGDHMVFAFSAFAAGLAAWTGSREGRRKTLDLVATTPRAVWARHSVALAGTLCWLLLAFGAGVAVLYIQTALQATWGGPPLWPVFVGAAAVSAVTLIGFTAGVLFPGRFTAPMAAIGVLVLSMFGFRQALGVTGGSGAGTYALLSPDNSPPIVDAGVYYHVAPDLSITQVMFMGGIAVALFGVLGLAPGLRRLAPGLRRLAPGEWLPPAIAILLVACGVAASATAFALAGTARQNAIGDWDIPALHSAASDQPTSVLPDCAAGAAFQVCVHPAFGFYLHDIAAILDPVAAEIAGLPGAPVRAAEVASISGGNQVQSGISGNPPVFEFTAEHVGNMFGEFLGYDLVAWREFFQQGLLGAFLTQPLQNAGAAQLAAGPGANPLDAAQLAVEDALLTAIGSPAMTPSDSGQQILKDPGTAAQVSAAAQRFGKLDASARHAWLATHLAALRAGTITLAQIP
jgi:hypothetical protein